MWWLCTYQFGVVVHHNTTQVIRTTWKEKYYYIDMLSRCRYLEEGLDVMIAFVMFWSWCMIQQRGCLPMTCLERKAKYLIITMSVILCLERRVRNNKICTLCVAERCALALQFSRSFQCRLVAGCC